MNKKEIAQQFTKQMLEQNPSILTQEQIISIILEIKNLYASSELRTKYLLSGISSQEQALKTLQHTAKDLDGNLEHLNKKIRETTALFQKSQEVSLFQRYWMVILMGILATLITNLIWILRMS